jgi:hypothetical protein
MVLEMGLMLKVWLVLECGVWYKRRLGMELGWLMFELGGAGGWSDVGVWRGGVGVEGELVWGRCQRIDGVGGRNGDVDGAMSELGLCWRWDKFYLCLPSASAYDCDS